MRDGEVCITSEDSDPARGRFKSDDHSTCSENELLEVLLAPQSPAVRSIGIYDNAKDLKSSGRRLKVALSPLGCKIATYVTRIASKNEENLPELSYEERFVYISPYGTRLDSGRLSLVNSTYEIFSAFQEVMNEIKGKGVFETNSKDDISKTDPTYKTRLSAYLTCSSYRSVMFKYISGPQEISKDLKNKSFIYRILFLFERLYFKRNLDLLRGKDFDSHVWDDLCVWIDTVHYNSDAKLLLEYKSSLEYKDSPQYNSEMTWTLIYKFLLSGKLELARSVIYCHPNFFEGGSENPYAILSMLIKSFPMPDGSTCWAEKIYKWRQILEKYIDAHLLSAMCYEERVYFLKAIEILRGSEKVILEVSDSWRRAFIGLYLYTYRGISCSSFGMLVKKVSHLAPKSILDVLEISVISQDLKVAISLCSKSDWWLTLHIIDIFYHSNILKQSFSLSTKMSLEFQIQNAILEMRKWYLFHYSELILTQSDLWQVGLEYLCQLDFPYGKCARALVRALPIQNSVMLKKVVSFCRKQRFDDEASVIKRSFEEKTRPLKAFTLLKELSKEPSAENLTSSLEILQKIIPASPSALKTALESISSTVSCTVMRARIEFLLAYTKFKIYLSREDYKSALGSIFKILQIRYFPIWTMSVIQTNVLNLLKYKRAFFSTSEVFEILYHINVLSDVCVYDSLPGS